MIDSLTPRQVDALGRMSRDVHGEYLRLKSAGLTVDPEQYLDFRFKTENDLHLKLMITDSGVFFLDPGRNMKYKFRPECLLVYHEGLSPEKERQVWEREEPWILLENRLEFWRKPEVGFCLVADRANGRDFLTEPHKKEFERVKILYGEEKLTLIPMLHRKNVSYP
jgi:hypothetical protein